MDLLKIRNSLFLGNSIFSLNLRVTFYTRVSTDHIEQKGSLKNQKDTIEEMIMNNPNWSYVEGYIDEGISGTTDYKRISFLHMIEDAKNGLFDLIITKEISRFSRNTLDSIKYTRELLSYGVAVYFINDNINTILPDSELRLTIMSSLAQDEVRRLSERVKFGMLRSIKNGNILGNDLQYGYKKNKNDGSLNIIEEEAIVVRRLFNYYAIDGLSLRKISKIFNEEHIKTAMNRKWNITTLKRMIENPKYKGTYTGKKTEIVDYMSKKKRIIPKDEWICYEESNRIPAIIDEHLWNIANNRLISRKNNNTHYQNRYLLSAKVVCMNDGSSYHRKNVLKTNKDVVWVCSNILNNGACSCISNSLRESEIYYILEDGLKIFNISLLNIKEYLKKYYKELPNYSDITKYIFEDNTIHNKLLELILFKINVYYIDKDINRLDIFFNFNMASNLCKNYSFKRGYNTTGTKRYIVKYKVNFINSKFT